MLFRRLCWILHSWSDAVNICGKTKCSRKWVYSSKCSLKCWWPNLTPLLTFLNGLYSIMYSLLTSPCFVYSNTEVIILTESRKCCTTTLCISSDIVLLTPAAPFIFLLPADLTNTHGPFDLYLQMLAYFFLVACTAVLDSVWTDGSLDTHKGSCYTIPAVLQCIEMRVVVSEFSINIKFLIQVILELFLCALVCINHRSYSLFKIIVTKF